MIFVVLRPTTSLFACVKIATPPLTSILEGCLKSNCYWTGMDGSITINCDDVISEKGVKDLLDIKRKFT